MNWQRFFTCESRRANFAFRAYYMKVVRNIHFWPKIGEKWIFLPPEGPWQSRNEYFLLVLGRNFLFLTYFWENKESNIRRPQLRLVPNTSLSLEIAYFRLLLHVLLIYTQKKIHRQKSSTCIYIYRFYILRFQTQNLRTYMEVFWQCNFFNSSKDVIFH